MLLLTFEYRFAVRESVDKNCFLGWRGGDNNVAVREKVFMEVLFVLDRATVKQ